MRRRSLPKKIPSTLVNSVSITVGLPYFAWIWRKAKSVMPPMGERPIMGFGRFCQEKDIGVLYRILVIYAI